MKDFSVDQYVGLDVRKFEDDFDELMNTCSDYEKIKVQNPFLLLALLTGANVEGINLTTTIDATKRDGIEFHVDSEYDGVTSYCTLQFKEDMTDGVMTIMTR